MGKGGGNKHYYFWTKITTMRPLKYRYFSSPLVGMGVEGQLINRTKLFSLLRVKAAHTCHLCIFANKRGWGNQHRKIKLRSKKATEAGRKARCRILASFSCRFTATEPAAAPTQAPATPGPCPAASGRFPPQGSAGGAVTSTGSLPNAPPRPASRLFTFKITFPWRPRRKQTCRLPLRAMGYV